jgi:hypothetical protein
MRFTQTLAVDLTNAVDHFTQSFKRRTFVRLFYFIVLKSSHLENTPCDFITIYIAYQPTMALFWHRFPTYDFCNSKEGK